MQPRLSVVDHGSGSILTSCCRHTVDSKVCCTPQVILRETIRGSKVASRFLLVVFCMFIALASAGNIPSAIAQSTDDKDGEEYRKGIDILILVEDLAKKPYREKIADAQEALRLLAEVKALPLGKDKEETAALLWWQIGTAYQQLGYVDQTNTEKAIEALEKVLTFQNLPRKEAFHGVTLAFLCRAYLERIKGNRAENVERAIAGCSNALQLLKPEPGSEGVAVTARINIGDAYRARLVDNLDDNAERAIAEYQIAVQQTDDKRGPGWERAQGNLASALLSRTHGEKLLNVEQAIAIYKQIQTEYPPEKNRRIWLANELRLAFAYTYRVAGSFDSNMAKTIEHAEAAVSKASIEDQRREWLNARLVLGFALMNLASGNLSENLDRAIVVFNEILSNSSAQTNPRIWSGTHSFLGDAYLKRTQGSRAENLEKAVHSLRQALNTDNEASVPIKDQVTAAAKLGGALLAQNKLVEASEALAQARSTYLLMLATGIDPLDASVLVTSAGSLFAESAFVAVQEGDVEKALSFVSEGRARQMAVALKFQTLNLTDEERHLLSNFARPFETKTPTCPGRKGPSSPRQ